MKSKILIFLTIAILGLGSCNSGRNADRKLKDNDSLNAVSADELWKQFLKVEPSTMEKLPPDSQCVLILNHIKVSYYKKNKLEFSDVLIEFLKNDSLIVYRVNNHPNIQIGYNRKDSVVLLTTGHPEGGIPTGMMEYFARKVEEASPFNTK